MHTMNLFKCRIHVARSTLLWIFSGWVLSVSCQAQVGYDDYFEAVFQKETALFPATEVVLNTSIPSAVDCDRLHATLFLASALLAAPIETSAEIDCVKTFVGEQQEMFLSFMSPNVKRQSSFLWAVEECFGDSGQCQEITNIQFRVFPDEILEPLSEWSKTNVLRVVDEQGEIAAILDDKKIDYRLASEFVPTELDARIVTLVHLPRRQEAVGTAALAYGNVIYFDDVAADPEEVDSTLSMLPAIVQRSQNNRIMVTVRFPVIDHIQESPYGQQLFLEIFNLASPLVR